MQIEEIEGFQLLKREFENAKVLDFRDPENPNNQIAIICEHASNALPDGYSWSDNDRKYFANENVAWDEGALETAIYLASELKCVLVHSLYSRLLIDIDKDIPSDELFQKRVGDLEIELNQNLTPEEELNRVTKYHVTFYHALREVSEKVNPKYVLGMNTLPHDQEEEKSTEIGIEFVDSDKFAGKLYEAIKGKGYSVEKNKPSAGIFRNVINTFLRANYPLRREGVEFNFRGDVIQDEEKYSKLKKDILEVIKELCIGNTEETVMS